MVTNNAVAPIMATYIVTRDIKRRQEKLKKKKEKQEEPEFKRVMQDKFTRGEERQ